MRDRWTAERIMEVIRAFQPACILAAACELDIFSIPAEKAQTADEVSTRIHADRRGTTILLDALAAMGLLHKQAGRYRTAEEVGALLGAESGNTLLYAVRHQANCLRRWAELGSIVRSGRSAERVPSLRGEKADQASFIGAMHHFSSPAAEALVREADFPPFSHLLDVGGASGTWTIAFLRAYPDVRATLFDLPEVIPLAEERLREAGLIDRVRLVGGDFYSEALPEGADLVWLGAVAHQNSREQNRRLFGQIHMGLGEGGHLVIRDVVMEDSRISPAGGALFAVNMLVNTEGGGTYTFQEYKEDLIEAGFSKVELMRRDEYMNSLIIAK